MNTLFLRLEGPLQSWGVRARWSERDTADAPTKSGVIGLLGCALGLRRDDQHLRTLSDHLRMGVRVDLPGTLMRDYHTTGSVLSAKVTKKGRIKVKINKKSKEPETDVSERYYLADASFRVALQRHDNLIDIDILARAVQRPVWPLFLGRKACVPTTPVFDGLGQFDDLMTALSEQTFSMRVLQAWERQRPAALRLLIETRPGDGNRQYDNIGVPGRRIFRPRYVYEDWLPLDTGSGINTLEG